MSTPSVHSEPVQEADRIHWPKVIAVAVATLVGFAIAIGFADGLLRNGTSSLREQRGLAQVPKALAFEQGIINQRPFVLDPRAAITRDAQLKFLHSYGWVDRKAKLIHIPIDKAMEMYLAKQGAGPQK